MKPVGAPAIAGDLASIAACVVMGQRPMPEPLTPTERQAMERRLQAATPGPWVAIEPASLSGGLPKTKVMHDGPKAIDALTVKDADFIAHAPVDLRRCLDEITRVEGELAMRSRVRSILGQAMPKPCCSQREALSKALGYCQAGAVESSPRENLGDVLEQALLLPCPCRRVAELEAHVKVMARVQPAIEHLSWYDVF